MSTNEIPKINNVRLTKLHLNKTEHKILSMALNNDDRVQNYYSKELFNCMYLSDVIQHLRRKLKRYFNAESGKDVLHTEYHEVIKKDGSNARIGIFRINSNYKKELKLLSNPILNNETQGSN